MAEPFVGRGSELAVLDRQLERATSGHGGLVVVTGQAGIGKTALIQHFAASRQARSIMVSGDQDEQPLAGGLCDQVAAAVGTAELTGLPEIATAGTGDPLRIGAALLDVLRAVAAEPPLMIVIDDAQWGDELSLRALTFALRRLRADPVLAIIAVRPESLSALPDGLIRLASDHGSRLELGGLDHDEVAVLAGLAGPGHLPPRVAKRLHGHTGGIPIHVTELLHDLPGSTLRDLSLALPAPQSLEALVHDRLASCSHDAQELVAAAAVLGADSSLAEAASLAGLDDPLPALEEAVSHRLLVEADRVDGRGCRFPHDLIRAASYSKIGIGHRTALHRAAATGRPGPPGFAHRVAGRTGPDPQLAHDLSSQARAELAAGQSTEAVEHLLTAVQVNDAGLERDRQLLTAVDMLTDLGDIARARAYLSQVEQMPESGRRSLVLGRLATLDSDLGLAEQRLTAAWAELALEGAADRPATGWRAAGWSATDWPVTDSPARAACDLALMLLRLRRPGDAAMWARRAADSATTEFTRACSTVVLSSCLAMAGRGDQARLLLESALEQGLGEPARSLTLAGLGNVLYWYDDLDAAASAVDMAVAGAPESGLPFSHLLDALLVKARVDFSRGSFEACAAGAERLASLADDLDQSWMLTAAHAAAVLPYAVRGQWHRAAQHADAARQAITPGNPGSLDLVNAQVAIAVASDDPAAVIAAVAPLTGALDQLAKVEPVLLAFWPSYAQALVRAGRIDEADTILAPFEALARDRDRRSALAAAQRARASIEAVRHQGDAARESFAASLDNAVGVGIAFEEAQTRLEYGRFLRRQNQPRAARREVGLARRAFASLGARPFLRMCDVEAGPDNAALPSAEPAPLTRRQLTVARAVAVGKSNREVATELYVSIKTVEFHVTQILSRLGVDSRAEIARALEHGYGTPFTDFEVGADLAVTGPCRDRPCLALGRDFEIAAFVHGVGVPIRRVSDQRPGRRAPAGAGAGYLKHHLRTLARIPAGLDHRADQRNRPGPFPVSRRVAGRRPRTAVPDLHPVAVFRILQDRC